MKAIIKDKWGRQTQFWLNESPRIDRMSGDFFEMEKEARLPSQTNEPCEVVVESLKILGPMHMYGLLGASYFPEPGDSLKIRVYYQEPQDI